ncbi:hypothetical protein Tco_0334531, partial [Tanacetum coccineum]
MNQSPLAELRETSNSADLSKMWTVAMQIETDTDFAIGRQLIGVVRALQASLNKRQAIIDEVKDMKNNTMVKSVAFFR